MLMITRLHHIPRHPWSMIEPIVEQRTRGRSHGRSVFGANGGHEKGRRIYRGREL